MISDRSAKIAKAYNVYTFGSIHGKSIKTKLAIPSTFLINKNQIIVWRYIGERAERPSIKTLLDAIENN